MKKNFKVLSMSFLLAIALLIGSNNINAATKTFTYKGCSITFNYSAVNAFSGKTAYNTILSLNVVRTTKDSKQAKSCSFSNGNVELVQSITGTTGYFDQTSPVFKGVKKPGFRMIIGHNTVYSGISKKLPSVPAPATYKKNAKTYFLTVINADLTKTTTTQVGLKSHVVKGKAGIGGKAEFKFPVQITSFDGKKSSTKVVYFAWSGSTVMK